MRRERSSIAPALIASALLHGAVLVGGMMSWPWMREAVLTPAVPVTLMTSDQFEALRSAAEADQAQEVLTETPVEDAAPETVVTDPEPAPPQPAPAASPRVPSPAAEAAPAKAPAAKPTPAKPAPKTAAQDLDLDALAASIARTRPGGGARASSAAQGRSQAQTDAQARAADGAARAAMTSALSAIQAKLIRLWNPNCGVEGAADVRVRVRVSLRADGGLVRAQLLDEDRIRGGGAVLEAAADRALSAVARAAPYDELPPETYAEWKTFTVNFNAKQACEGL